MDSIRGPSCQIHKERFTKQVPLSAISATNSKVAVLQPSAGAKVRGTYLKVSTKAAKIGKRAAEHGVLATIRYHATNI